MRFTGGVTEAGDNHPAANFGKFPGYVTWFDFGRTDLITHASDIVSSVDSIDGNFAATPIAGGSSILTNTNSMNGRNVLLFDGGGTLEFGAVSTMNAMHNGTGGTVYMVVRDTVAAGNPASDLRVLGGTAPFATSLERGFVMIKENRTVPAIASLRLSVGNDAANVALANSVTGSFEVNQAKVIVFRFADQAGTDLKGQINSDEVIDANKGVAAVSAGDGTNKCTIGGRPNKLNGWQGDVSECGYYSSYHDDATVSAIVGMVS